MNFLIEKFGPSRAESHLDIFKLINIGIGMKRMKRKYFEFLRNLQIEREA